MSATWCVRDLLEVLLGPLELVGRDVAILLEPFELLADGTPHIAHGDPRLLGLVVDDLDHLLAPFLGQLREGDADDGAVVVAVGCPDPSSDRLLDALQRGLVERAR